MTDQEDQGPPPVLPARDARPLVMHVAVDAIIAFLVTAVVLFFFGVPLWVMIVVAWVLGLGAAPFTRRWEARQLAARTEAT